MSVSFVLERSPCLGFERFVFFQAASVGADGVTRLGKAMSSSEHARSMRMALASRTLGYFFIVASSQPDLARIAALCIAGNFMSISLKIVQPWLPRLREVTGTALVPVTPEKL
jgi:hypothetical protein